MYHAPKPLEYEHQNIGKGEDTSSAFLPHVKRVDNANQPELMNLCQPPQQPSPLLLPPTGEVGYSIPCLDWIILKECHQTYRSACFHSCLQRSSTSALTPAYWQADSVTYFSARPQATHCLPAGSHKGSAIVFDSTPFS